MRLMILASLTMYIGVLASEPVLAQRAAELADKKAEKLARRAYYANRNACLNPAKWSEGSGDAIMRVCDLAMIPPATVDELWFQPSLIRQQRAILFYRNARYDDALAALEASDAIGKGLNDILFDNSIKLGNQLFRALVFLKQGQSKNALALVESLRDVRPYSVSIRRRIESVYDVITGDSKAAFARLNSRIRFEPELLERQMVIEIIRNNLSAAYDLASKVVIFNDPVDWGSKSSLPRDLTFAGNAENQLLRAYLAAALGKQAEADQIIAAIKTESETYLGSSPQLQKPGTSISKKAQEEYDFRLRTVSSLALETARWEAAMKLRNDAATLKGEDLLPAMIKHNMLALPIGSDLRRQLQLAAGPLKDINDKAIGELTALVDSSLIEVKVHDMLNLKIPVEFQKQVPKFGKSFVFKTTGYSQEIDNALGTRLVRFGSYNASRAMSEELNIRAAATIALEEGKDSFVIVSQKMTSRSTTYYGAANYTASAGFESHLRVSLLDSKTAGSEWVGRTINAQNVLDRLKPQFEQFRDAEKNPDQTLEEKVEE